MKNTILILFLGFFASLQGIAQSLTPLFVPFSQAGIPLQNALAGGLNTPQFSTADFNQDGLQDIAVFDRVGEVWSCFLNNGSTTGLPYTFAPEYAKNLPKCTYWALLRDFNCDGIADLFTNRPNGIRVFRGYYQGGMLKFALRSDQLFYINPYTNFTENIYVNQIDIPDITDMDNDGDLDMVFYDAGGSYIEYYKNFSLEAGFGCDSLNFKITDNCWGRMEESQLNSTITLSPRRDSCIRNGNYIGGRHPGSTILCFDGDGDGDKEALIGDISGTRFIYLTNGLNKDTAYMTAQVTPFPTVGGVTSLVFPAAYHLDTDNDGKRDLVVATNETKVNENYQVWNYKNAGTDAAPNFQLSNTSFLTGSMIDIGSQSVPMAFDYNNDGLTDLIIGGLGKYRNNGSIKYRSSLQLYKNIGTATAPQFDLVTDDWLGLASQNYYGLTPCVGDIDGDGDRDILMGNEDGNLILLRNDGWNGTEYNFSSPINNWQGIDVGVASAPDLADLNRDGKLDLIIGERAGNVNYYQNNGNGTYTLVTEALGNIDGRNNALGFPSGATIPRFYTTDAGAFQVLVGTEAGNIQRYGNIINNLAGSFTRIDSAFGYISQGYNTAPLVVDIDGDEKNDFFVGNRRGGLSLYVDIQPVANTPPTPEETDKDWRVFPNPTRTDWHVSIQNPTKMLQQYTLFNQLGQVLRTFSTVETDFICTTNDLTDGVYFLLKTNNNSISTQKIVLMR